MTFKAKWEIQKFTVTLKAIGQTKEGWGVVVPQVTVTLTCLFNDTTYTVVSDSNTATETKIFEVPYGTILKITATKNNGSLDMTLTYGDEKEYAQFNNYEISIQDNWTICVQYGYH